LIPLVARQKCSGAEADLDTLEAHGYGLVVQPP
jgi:hypothetical protein